MNFRSFHNLKNFAVIAQHMNFTSAAEQLHLTKGALSYQIKKLEQELGFDVFLRSSGRISLTPKGARLLSTARTTLMTLENEIDSLRDSSGQMITIGMSTYFASRWLSSRLMRFTSVYRDIGLRIQPTLGLANLRETGLDMTIRWGNGGWQDLPVERLFNCPAIATAGRSIAKLIEKKGLERTLPELTLLHDTEDSRSWRDWHQAANLTYHDQRHSLVIPDPNVRVQAVIDGQGVALNDFLINDEIVKGELKQVSPTALLDYGYFLAYNKGAMGIPALKLFRNWLVDEARSNTSAPA